MYVNGGVIQVQITHVYAHTVGFVRMPATNLYDSHVSVNIYGISRQNVLAETKQFGTFFNSSQTYVQKSHHWNV